MGIDEKGGKRKSIKKRVRQDIAKVISFVDNKGNNVSSDFRFASAVAMFGQLLRDSDFKGEATYDKVISLAKQGLDHDDKGYRREFVRLVEAVKGIQQEK